jgi:hypothetical protein
MATERGGTDGSGRRPRDPRLDFFRGIAMLVIIVSHVPWNPWANWIPARFGFSDAAEIFVFCSGFASALAFGALYARRGWVAGTVAIALRVWHVYWVHIGVFLVILAAMLGLNALIPAEPDYVKQLNLQNFVDRTGPALLGLLTLTYVPNYFDILPMYLVILALVPVMMGLATVSRGLVAGLVGVLWLGANLGVLALPAEPWSERAWFFNPFGWQLLFFLAFAFGAGWLRPPPVTPRLVAIAAGIVIFSVFFSRYDWVKAVGLAPLFEALVPLMSKSSLAPFRVIHFLALAYLAWVAVGPRGERLSRGQHLPAVSGVLQVVGQHSLPVFAFGMLLSRLMGVVLDLVGRGSPAVAAVNIAGLALAVGLAYALAWLKDVRRGALERTAPQARPASEASALAFAAAGGTSSQEHRS